ncbi:response regulator transcription factor [Streptantibioticus ferralitis]|uniref:Response regulator transcription factor n=1 Tax=Streptantibioticus ferralitis TaxID=236510 RepID=A0ABT5Z3F5_9ACTN|nr:response regulator transcription factor [Streptantibioticus ferralitis]MDF2257565.1 response regulator transcription factor [Streptantibioticus ferralitis]
MRVLLVEDEPDLSAIVASGLRAAGFFVDTADDWPAADELLHVNAYDCVVLDRLVPHGDTRHELQQRRRAGWSVPVLFLTALHTVDERITGFEHGADDYLVKPFAMAELVMRVRSLARRAQERLPVFLRCADLELDLARREVRRAGVLLSLTRKELAVLHRLLISSEQVVTKGELFRHGWDESADPSSNVVEAVVAGLRRKLGGPQLVHTVWGEGFRLSASPMAGR